MHGSLIISNVPKSLKKFSCSSSSCGSGRSFGTDSCSALDAAILSECSIRPPDIPDHAQIAAEIPTAIIAADGFLGRFILLAISSTEWGGLGCLF